MLAKSCRLHSVYSYYTFLDILDVLRVKSKRNVKYRNKLNNLILYVFVFPYFYVILRLGLRNSFVI